ncbi:MAG: hypothetical protein AAF458_15205 [Pseudomonadota bacterium]
MSFLDDLKKEAEQVKARQQEASSTTQSRRTRMLQSVRPKMQALYKYLKDACEQLCIVDPDVHVSYELRGFGKLGPLRQGEYKVVADDPRNLDKFTLSFACTRPNQIQFQIEGKETASAQKEYMWSCNLRFTSKMTAENTGVFFLDSHVLVTVEFEADLEEGKINMRMRNMDALGTSRASFEPDQINEEFMDELGKCMIRKSNRFQEISGNSVSEETRMRLRQQLAQDQYRRQIEAASGGAQAQEGAAAKPKPKKKPEKKKGLLRSLFKG